ncbi:response regulator [Elongatibacter sediminis]|uniref:Response regulator n=1 Tax=Elongatibacter sediminis TaxID=3119006 RepID=A0AAW9RC91_9GAMM
MASILIVDDSAFARSSLQIIVEGGGHKVIGRASNGEEAVDLFNELKPELVTLDFLMAGETGDQVLERLLDITPDARVIMISGMGDPAIQEKAMAAGAKCFLPKPFKKGEVLNSIDRVLQP